MLANLLKFLRRLFGNSQMDDYEDFPHYDDVVNFRSPKPVANPLPAKKVEQKKKTVEKKLFKPQIIPPTAPGINKSVLMRKIKTNIFFLEQLLDVLEQDPAHRHYYQKVKDMKNQSESCFKLAHRIKEDAIYYQNTMKMILDHTKTIAQLIDIK